MRVLARIGPGPHWVAGQDVYHQGPAIRDHLAFMAAGFDDGTLLLGGPLATGMEGIALLEVADIEAAEAFARADPGVTAGVLAYDVQEVVTFFDVFAFVDATGRDAPTGRAAAACEGASQ